MNDRFRKARFGHHHTVPVEENHAFYALGASFHLEILVHGVADILVALGIKDVRRPNAVRPRIRVRIDQNGINHAENCRGGTNAQSQGEHRDGGGHTTLHEQPQCVPDVLQDQHEWTSQ